MASLEDLTVDQLLAKAREYESSAGVLNQLSQNPKTRETIQRALKTLNPNLVIPEIDAGDAIRSELKAEREERQKLEQRLLEREVRENVKERRNTIKEKYKLSDDEVMEVEKLMVDKDNPIPSHDAAARVFLASRAPSTPTPSSFSPPVFTMPEKDTWGGGIGSKAKLDKIAMNEAYAALAEIKQGKVPGLSISK
jgi:hypothetical protein